MTQTPTQPITQLIHHPYVPPAEFHAPQTGVFKASTVIFPNVAAMRSREWKDKSGYTYGLHGTPTTFILEERIATLEGGLQCLLVPSGLAAIANIDLALLHTGDEVLIPDNAYGPGKALADGELKNFGITHRFFDAMDPADLAGKINHKTKLVWLEAPGSVTMEFADLLALVRTCKTRGVLCALDNTWGAGLAFNAFNLDGQGTGVDISMQALTKYPSGGGDVLMGSVVTRDAALHLKIKLAHMRLGLGVAANDAELVLRNLPSIALRYQAHDVAARQLATWLQTRPELEAVLHPALAGAPGHENWKKITNTCYAIANATQAATKNIAMADSKNAVMTGAGGDVDDGAGKGGLAAGLFSVVFKPSYTSTQVDRFCDALKLFKLGFSWGGHLSLVVPYDVPSMRDASVSLWPYRGTLVRFNIGLEDVSDLQTDLSQALQALQVL